MNGEKGSWSQHVANLARAAFWFLLVAILLLQLLGSRGQDSQRAALLGNFEKERSSRVIAMIHRQESASILGVPVAGSISIDDSEAILRAIRLKPPDQPIDLSLHTQRVRELAAEKDGNALIKRKAKGTVFVPHYAMSGGTLIALAADEIVMDANAVLGPVDPQIGDLPAASIVKVVQLKGPAKVGDEMLILADMAQKARNQVGSFVVQLLLKHMPEKPAGQLATVLSEGRWTHDFPITVQAARQLGLKVSTDMPRSVYDLMDLYPQGVAVRPSVLYAPIRRSAAPGNAPHDKSAPAQP